MIRIVVDLELCGAHGMCEREAPELFRVVENAEGYAHVQVLLETLPEAQRLRADSAARQCPNQALKLVEG
jgi:ferredoxin